MTDDENAEQLQDSCAFTSVKRDKESGRITPKYPTEDFLDAVAAHEPVSTHDVAAEVGCEMNTARYRLKRLEANGRVTSDKFGMARAWSLSVGERKRYNLNDVEQECDR